MKNGMREAWTQVSHELEKRLWRSDARGRIWVPSFEVSRKHGTQPMLTLYEVYREVYMRCTWRCTGRCT